MEESIFTNEDVSFFFYHIFNHWVHRLKKYIHQTQKTCLHNMNWIYITCFKTWSVLFDNRYVIMKTLDCLRVGDFVVLFICLFVCLHMMLTFLLGWFFLKGKFVCVMVVNNFNPSQEEEADGARSTECVLGQPVLHREILFRKKKKNVSCICSIPPTLVFLLTHSPTNLRLLFLYFIIYIWINV